MLLIVIIGAISLSGCTNNSPTTNNQPTAAGVSTTSSSTSADDAKIEALISEKLQNHHSSDRIYSAHKTREEWNITLDRMISYGAKISADEKQQMIDWLLARNN
jgi:outer membrane lipoprotein SlyB